MAELTKSLTGTGVVSYVGGYYSGYTVTTVLGAGAITIYDNASAASGTIIDIIPQSTAAGTTKNLANPIRVKNGIYASFASTGTVTFIYD